MLCPRIAMQAMYLCSRACPAASLSSAQLKITNILKHTRSLRLREFSCTTTTFVKEGRLFSKDHEWVLPKSDISSVTFGISDYAQDKLGDIVYVDLPEKGTQLSKGDTCGVVESVKAASDLFSMLDGQVLESNPALEATPDLINKDPLNEGWMLKLTVDNPEQLDELMSQEEYDKFIEEADK